MAFEYGELVKDIKSMGGTLKVLQDEVKWVVKKENEEVHSLGGVLAHVGWAGKGV